MNHNRLLIAIVIGAVLGCLFGVYFPEQAVSIGIVGDLFLNALKMMVLPLIVTSLVVGITNLGDIRHLGSMGVKTVAYYLTTTGIAVAIGIVLVANIQPGSGVEQFAGELPERIASKGNFSFWDVLRGIIHPNIFQAAADFQILPIIFASLLFGAALTTLKEKGKVIVDFFAAANETVMRVIHWIIFFTPLGVFGLIAARLGAAGGGDAFFDIIRSLGMYAGTVILGLLIHGVIVLPIILFIFAKRNPWQYFLDLGNAIATAFATSSSSATLPVTMECVIDEAKVSSRTSSVVLPLGATVNMDGTALYEAVAAIFIAQTYGIDLGLGEMMIIFLTATLAAIGAAGIPEAGLVTMVMVLQAVGLPIEGIGIILAIDWFLDRCRTTVNVWGDAIGAAVVDAWEGNGRAPA